MRFIDPTKGDAYDREEWRRMWEALAKQPINVGLPVPDGAEHGPSGEVWQYMGTYDNERCWPCHQFRHRWHPVTDKQEIINLVASVEWTYKPAPGQLTPHVKNNGALLYIDCND